ncbi:MULTISPECIES: response regulator transcription factor [Methylomonas]|uniref:LuxR family transcriptional regulator n=2 Tax=Methylomonas TaxID=416 RepID=A0A126T2W9_9GAMM|nr:MULTISPECIES: response regulator transcription factor [Methylomonas]AMK76420.1 LuxR family transcriptional regulator [Methylomonas denitrificans]OAH98679.1 DNA-binding response regulator [Methylomonas methanica]TCV88453.1 LuxR family two component transcriptional regulator [Methylomonas methanica]
MTNTTSALVIDDHPLSASGIADFLLSHCGFGVALPVSDVGEFWAALDPVNPPSLAVVDFWLPDGASLGLLELMKQRCPATRLLAISADDNAAVLDKVRMAGVDGFLHKQETPDIFGRAVAALLQGDNWFHGGTQSAGREFANKELPVTAAELGLTARQGQVLAMMLKGLPNKRIALNLSLSEQTVKEHVSGILERLGARNRIEVITKLRGRRLE